MLRGLSYLYVTNSFSFFFLFLEGLVSVSKRKDQSRMRLRNTMGVFRSSCMLHGVVGVAALGGP